MWRNKWQETEKELTGRQSRSRIVLHYCRWEKKCFKKGMINHVQQCWKMKSKKYQLDLTTACHSCPGQEKWSCLRFLIIFGRWINEKIGLRQKVGLNPSSVIAQFFWEVYSSKHISLKVDCIKMIIISHM